MAKNVPTPNQSQIFLEGEGDQWFERNKEGLQSKTSFYETETIKRVLAPYKKDIRRILEIGCGNGAKLNDVCRFFESHGIGIDPSTDAVTEGNRAIAEAGTPDVALRVSVASRLPSEDSSFDLVYFGFCLYLVDRDEIYRAIAEADRVLKAGGFLAILDFDPGQRHKRPYHHKPGVFSYKTSHSDFFTAGGHYYLVAKESFSHGANHFSPDSNERISVCILYKEPDAY